MTFKKAIITSGPTREWIDPVRYISNASSGKMGYCIAYELSKKIPEIVYICGNTTERYATFQKGKTIKVETTIEMKNSVLSEIEESTLLIMAAAPADFRPKKQERQKIKKSLTGKYTIELIENPDILIECKKKIQFEKWKNTRTIGFAAETKNLKKYALDKLNKKGLSYIIGNYVDSNQKGFGEKDTTVQIYSTNGIEITFGPAKKEKIAQAICHFLLKKL
ncbi:MAG: phosphopantothenoylcysteine decarboxylase [Leptospiraceae bacterium]|nr:phosphopantothenoylcysteine decarboxylase [Leptospiraceae bacterium]MCK6379883.1 phosphopantothenoylcysteine decarboxylase [Leptospiraceae bacterium]